MAGRPRGGPRARPPARAAPARPAPPPRAAAGSPRPLRLPPPPAPGGQYVSAVEAGGLLFVSGHDPERRGRLVYRGRVGRDLGPRRARAALRLATRNALAAAAAAAGSLSRVRRCVTLGAFVDGLPGSLSPALARDALDLVGRAIPAGTPPVLWLRPAHGLAGGMPVEVELVLELAPREGGGASRAAGAAAARAPRRAAGRTR